MKLIDERRTELEGLMIMSVWIMLLSGSAYILYVLFGDLGLNLAFVTSIVLTLSFIILSLQAGGI